MVHEYCEHFSSLCLSHVFRDLNLMNNNSYINEDHLINLYVKVLNKNMKGFGFSIIDDSFLPARHEEMCMACFMVMGALLYIGGIVP